MSDPSGVGTVEIDLLRPVEWLQSLDADEGETIYFALPEMGIEGPAVVEDIEPCPDIEDGPGRVVLATTESSTTRAMQLEFEGQDAPLVATAPHRFYSEDQDAWVPAEKLRAGEHLRTQTGTLTLKSVQPKPGTYRVYNLEVETDHCYFVTDDAVLTHNMSPCGAEIPEGGVYLLRDPKTDAVWRTGRSGNLDKRARAHRARSSKTRGLDFEVVYRTDVYAEQRGLEQVLYETHKGAPLNKIRALSPRHESFKTYMNAANRFLEKLEQ